MNKAIAMGMAVLCLEQAQALTVTVTNTLNNGAGSLRRAINDVNDSVDPANTILFAVPGGPPVLIEVTNLPLPAITNQVTLDGSSQPGWAPDAPAVQLTGPSVVGYGLSLSGAPSVVRGLLIRGFTNTFNSAGVGLLSPGHTVAGNGLISNHNGIVIASASNRIGGLLPSTNRNVISGNLQAGIFINNGSPGYNRIIGNYIGLDAAGTGAMPNVSFGIANFGSPFNTIGGTNTLFRNVISGNGVGILLDNAGSSNNTISGNFVGTDRTGSNRVGNTGSGIQIGVGRNNVIGGTAGAETRNLISANNVGVSLGSPTYTALTVGNLVIGNWIGVDLSGQQELSNRLYGVSINGGSSNRIGGVLAGEGNVVSGNAFYDIILQNTGTQFTAVQGNLIGPFADGTSAPAGGSSGLAISGAGNTEVGGLAPGARNILSGNAAGGLAVFGGAVNTTVHGNYVGLQSDGVTPLPNLAGGVNLVACTNTAVRANILSGNALYGLSASGAETAGLIVQANFVGCDASGSLPLPNSGGGLFLAGTEGALVGGTNATDGNVIAFSPSVGIYVVSNALGRGIGNAILGNRIFGHGSRPIDLGNDGPTANDVAPDADNGANGLQNYPVVTNAQQGSTTVQGFLVSATSLTFRCEFFATNVPQGMLFLGASNLVTSAGGTAVFTAVIFPLTLPTSAYVIATATDPAGNTSELGPGARVRPAIDSDADGLWDSWEVANFGTLASNGTGNADGDALSNYQEFLADTSPTNAAALFELENLTNQLPRHVVWNSSASRWYDIDFSPDLQAPVWFSLASNVVGVGGAMSLGDASGDTNRFYRARAKLP